jgi:hypothetical protein
MPSIHDLRACGTSIRRIAILLGISRNKVRRHLRGPRGPKLSPPWHGRAIELFGVCGRNGAEVARRLREEGCAVSIRGVQRVVRQARVIPSAPASC